MVATETPAKQQHPSPGVGASEAGSDAAGNPPAPSHYRLGYVPGLDGLRGVAVIAVLLFHGGVTWATGGFLGVDMFFVLSGFLITSLLIDERWKTGAVRLSKFWARRARRLLPALLAVLAAMGAYAMWVPMETPLSSLRRDVFATLAYVSNWHFIIDGGSYFARNAPPSPLRHTWSLAIEEQFYLLWPLLFIAVARGRAKLTKLAVLIGAGIAGSIAAMVALYHPGTDASRVYYGTDTRVHVILIGCGLAVVMAGVNQRHVERGRSLRLTTPARWLLGLGALDAVLFLVWAMWYGDGDQPWLYRGGFAAVSVATAVLITAAVLDRRGVVAQVFGFLPLRWVGRISYGLYLWHWPIYLVLTRARTHLQGAELLGLRLGTTLAVSMVSYWMIELPFRRGWLPKWQSGLAVALAGAAVVGLILSTTGVGPLAPKSAVALAAAGSSSGLQAEKLASPARPVTPTSTTVPVVTNRPLRAAGVPVKVMVLGDSVGLTLTQGLTSSAARYDLSFTNNAVLGCGLVQGGPYRYFGQVSKQLSSCDTWPTKWASLVGRVDPDVVEVVVGRWEVMDRVYNGHWTHLGDPDFDDYIRSELERSFSVLSTGGAVVAYVTAPYYLRGERPDGGRWPEDDPARVDAMNAIIRSVVAAHPGQAAIVDLNAHTSTTNAYTKSIDGVVLRSDGVHFTPAGAKWLAPWILPTLHDLGPASQTTRGSTARSTTTTTTSVRGTRTSSTTTTTTTASTTRSTVRSSTTTTTRPARTTTTVKTRKSKQTSRVPPRFG